MSIIPQIESGHRSTELRVRIIEDAHGNIQTEFVAFLQDSEIVVPMRTSHIVGQLMSAAWLIANGAYSKIQSKTPEVNNLQGKKSSEKGKIKKNR